MAFANILAFENFLLLMVVIFGLQLVDRSLGPVLLLHLEALGYDAAAATRLVGVLFSLLALAGALGNQLAASALARATRARRDRRRHRWWRAAALGVVRVVEPPWALIAAHLHRRRRRRRRHDGGVYRRGGR